MLKFLVCPECDKILTARRNTTAVLINHLKKSHNPPIYITNELIERVNQRTEEVYKTMEAELEDSSSICGSCRALDWCKAADTETDEMNDCNDFIPK